MTDQQKITHWSYPFKARATAEAGRTEDAWLYQDALANALGGHYPLGTNGLWHGGVHFDQGSAGLLDQSSVYCIADGEVIAHRIDERYPVSEYESGPKPYSTGFVLVRHRLEVPKPTPTTAPQPTAEAPSPAPSLTLFSLYMHLLDWDHYQQEGAPTPPSFISETLYAVRPDKATDPTLGLRVRSTPGDGPVVALLPKGTRVEVGDAHPGSAKWRRLLNVIEGAALPSLAACGSGWVFTGELEPTPTANVFLVGEHANDHEPTLAPQRGLNIRKTGRGNAGDPKTGLLPEGARISLEPGTTPYRKIRAIVEGSNLAPLTANSAQNIHGYVHFDSLQATRTTPVCGAVHLLDPPCPIQAGELIGHPGHYQNHNDGAPQSLLHLEVFSCDDVPAFIAQSRALAAALPAEQKTQLKIHKGASKLIPHREGIDANHPPSITDAGTTIGVDLIIPLSTLERLPSSHKITLDTAANPGPVTHWWRLDNLLADNDGNPISGWLAEQDLITTRHNPWEWEGFECVEDTGTPLEKLAYTFYAQSVFGEDEMQNYRAQISRTDSGSMLAIARLYDIVDNDKDGVLTHEEIQTALKKSWHAQVLGQLITQYESEWFWNQSKWDELDPLLATPLDKTNQDWRIEKQRIEKLCWWREVVEQYEISRDGKAWHMAAVGLSENFNRLTDENDLMWLKVPQGQLTFDAEGNDITNSVYFSRVAHWPQSSSGLTIGRGYDLGQRPHPETDLTEAGVTEPLFSWLIGAKGLKGQSAKMYLDRACDEIKKTQITRKQQYRLFMPVYEFMKNEVIRISNSPVNIESYGPIAWNEIHRKIQDIAVDLIYRGDYTPDTRKTIQQCIIDNDLPALRIIMAEHSHWLSVPSDRFNRRANYLR
ncbi:hypothetical protein [Pseudomonas sp.]|uniref:hypothetical protein n=1 Tax=Pseudomonas sp. TaxID=306 RepID=UPI0028AD9F2B|nr:hypothetical protein [Pseudomonas sp.]